MANIVPSPAKVKPPTKLSRKERKAEELRKFNEARRARLKALLGDQVTFSDPEIDYQETLKKECQERRAQYKRRWREANRDKVKAISRAAQKKYRQAHPEKVAAYKKSLKYKEYQKKYQKAYRAKIKARKNHTTASP